MQATIKDKIRYLVVKHPQVKPALKVESTRDLRNIKDFSKIVLISENDLMWRQYLLTVLLKNPRAQVREVDMAYVLDVFVGNVEDERSLWSMSSDILVIHDGRLKMTHNQKDVLLAQLWENSPIIIYDWRGDKSSFNSRCQLDKSLYKEVIVDGKHSTKSEKVCGPVDSDFF